MSPSFFGSPSNDGPTGHFQRILCEAIPASNKVSSNAFGEISSCLIEDKAGYGHEFVVQELRKQTDDEENISKSIE